MCRSTFTLLALMVAIALLSGIEARVLSRRESPTLGDQIPVAIVNDPEPQIGLQQKEQLAITEQEEKSAIKNVKEEVKDIKETIKEQPEKNEKLSESKQIKEEELKPVSQKLEKTEKLEIPKEIEQVEQSKQPIPLQEEPSREIQKPLKALDEPIAPVKSLDEPIAPIKAQDEPIAPIESIDEPKPLSEKIQKIDEKLQEPEAKQNLKTPIDSTAEVATAEAQPIAAALIAEEPLQANKNEEPLPSERQAAVTQATPTQSTSTQQNFIQQLIQNSPVGQFLNQFNGANQQQQQQSDNQPPAPTPTVPGFLNPQAAITSAQQAVQNAAQTVVNSTTQAFQGLQQFASNVGNQFQSTLSGLTGQQQQQQAAEATTSRPPGPIQSFVSNLFGGNNATAANSDQQPQQPQGPFQGIINFLGGNRPQNANAASSTQATPSADKPVDNKIDEPTPDGTITVELPAQDDATNEVRNSGEIVEDSFEELAPVDDGVIVVNDEVGTERKVEHDKKKPEPVVAA